MGLAKPLSGSAMWRRRRLARYLLYPGAEISAMKERSERFS